MKDILKSFLRGVIIIGVILLLEVVFLKTGQYKLCAVLIGAIVVLAGIANFVGWGRFGDRNKKEQEKHNK